jgi:hypothetical protein
MGFGFLRIDNLTAYAYVGDGIGELLWHLAGTYVTLHGAHLAPASLQYVSDDLIITTRLAHTLLQVTRCQKSLSPTTRPTLAAPSWLSAARWWCWCL